MTVGALEEAAFEMDVSESGGDDGERGASSTSSTRTSVNSQDASIGGSDTSITMGSACHGDKPTD